MKQKLIRIIGVVLICALTPSIALSRPLNETGEPPYDPSEHSYEGKICWTTEFSYNDDRNEIIRQICVMDLATGEIKRAEIPENVYLVYTDEYKGVLLAQETDGVVTLYNWTGGDEYTKLFSYEIGTDSYMAGGGLYYGPCSIYAYMNGCIYFQADGNRFFRDDMSGSPPYEYDGFAYPNADGNSVEYKYDRIDKVYFLQLESPELGVYRHLSSDILKGKYNTIGGFVCWLSEDRFLFQAVCRDDENNDVVLMYYDISTGAYGAWLSKSNELIHLKSFSVGCAGFGVLSRYPELFLGIKTIGSDAFGGMPIYGAVVLIDIATGAQTVLYESKVTDEYTEWTSGGNRVVWIYE